MLRTLGAFLLHNSIASLALVVALAGTSYAAAKFTGADIVDESLTGADVQNDSITGDDVLESSLGKVGNADQLDGLDSTGFVQNDSAAGGDLAGTYPDPTLGVGVVTTGAFGAIPTVKVTRCCLLDEIPGDATPTTLTFTAEEFDVGGMHDPSTDPSRLTAPATGVYLVMANVSWPHDGGNGIGFRELVLKENGFFFRARAFDEQPAPSSPTPQSLSVMIELHAGDYLELEARQTSGGALTISSVYPTNFSMSWIAPG